MSWIINEKKKSRNTVISFFFILIIDNVYITTFWKHAYIFIIKECFL